MNIHGFHGSFRTVLAVGVLVTMLGGSESTSGQISQGVKKKAVVTVKYPQLGVKQFSGDFAQWGLTGSIEKGELTEEFRWVANRSGVAAARYEVSLQAFPLPAPYQAGFNLKGSSVLPAPATVTTVNYFTIDFKPLLQEVFGTSEPKESATFYVRLVLLDAGKGPLSPVSQTVKIQYSPPSAGTKLDRPMNLYLKSIKCITQTSGPGSDDIDVKIIGARLSNVGEAKVLYYEGEDDIDDDWAIHPSKLLWDYSGPGLDPKFAVLVALREEDINPSGFTAVFPIPNRSWTAGLVSEFRKNFCQVEDVQCLGSPQVLPVTQADFNKVALNGQVVTKKLTFSGDGGAYEIVFELRPK